MVATASLPRRLYKFGIVFLLIAVILIIHYGGQDGYQTHMDIALPTAVTSTPVMPLCTCTKQVVTETVTVAIQLPTTAASNKPASKQEGPISGWRSASDEDYESLLTESDFQLIQQLRNYTLTINVNTHERKPDPTTPVFSGVFHARKQLFSDLYSIGSPSGLPSWKEYLESLPPQHLPPLTHITQHYIYSHQHPTAEECKSKTKFLVLPSLHRSSGLGSIFHGATHALSVAIRSGRVLIYDHRDGENGIGIPGALFAGTGAGCPGSARGVDCFFEPITSCSWSDVRLSGSGTADEPNAILFHQYNVRAYEAVKHPTLGYVTRFGDIPPVLGFLLQEWEELASGGTGVLMSPNARKLWWRGQGTAYLARINPWALERVKGMRLSGELKRVGIRGVSGPGTSLSCHKLIF